MSNELIIPDDNEERKVDLVETVEYADTYAQRRQLKRKNPLSKREEEEESKSEPKRKSTRYDIGLERSA